MTCSQVQELFYIDVIREPKGVGGISGTSPHLTISKG